jgi:hypothetical protein
MPHSMKVCRMDRWHHTLKALRSQCLCRRRCLLLLGLSRPSGTLHMRRALCTRVQPRHLLLLLPVRVLVLGAQQHVRRGWRGLQRTVPRSIILLCHKTSPLGQAAW